MHYTNAVMKKNRKGFTLAELLIVVAIIGVLVAVSIPIFSAQLEKSREATDIANMRAAKALAIAAYYDIESGDKTSTNIGGLAQTKGGGKTVAYQGYYDYAKGTFTGSDAPRTTTGYGGKGTSIDTGKTYTNYNSAMNYKEQAIYVEIVTDTAWGRNYLPSEVKALGTQGKGILLHWRYVHSNRNYSPDYGFEWIPLE